MDRASGMTGATPNRLFVPLVAVCIVCAAEAVVIAYLLGRGAPVNSAVVQSPLEGTPRLPAPPPAVVATTTKPPTPDAAPVESASKPSPIPPSSPSAPKTTAPVPAGPAVARGNVGQRVELAGLTMTVTAVTNKPRFDVFAPRSDEKFIDCDVLLENRAPKGFDYFSNEFKIQDDQSRVFSGGALGVGDPQLGYGTVVQGTKARGHVAFIVPKDAKGLTLTYPIDDAPGNARAIHIDLGQ
jgi:hypothetical protein